MTIMQNNQKDKKATVVPPEDMEAAIKNPSIKGVLARVFKIFLVSFGKDIVNVWDRLMEAYVTDPNNNIPNDRAKQTSAKGNMKREYLGPNLSFAKFCEAMRFAKFKRLHITFTASDEKGVSHRLTEEIDFENINAAEFVVEDFVKNNVSVVNSDNNSFDDGASDALEMINKPKTKTPLKGKDWLVLPNSKVQSIIEENTKK